MTDPECSNPDCRHPKQQHGYGKQAGSHTPCHECGCPMYWGLESRYCPDPENPSKTRQVRLANIHQHSQMGNPQEPHK